MAKGMDLDRGFLRLVQSLQFCAASFLILFIGVLLLIANPDPVKPFNATTGRHGQEIESKSGGGNYWQPPDSTLISKAPEGDLIRYGRELIAHTAVYLGPQGKIMRVSNSMNCQNCHLKAGKKPFGNNYSAVASTYPKFRPRSGSVETIEKRVNDCIQRSLNGKPLEENSVEMKAFVAYISWVGNEVEKGVIPKGSGIRDLALLDRAADPVKGKLIFTKHCALCHGENGQGIKAENGIEWKYPPLWGNESYNVSAGLFRLSRFAGYVKANMPNGTTFENPVLIDEEAWDVAAYVNSMPRPLKEFEEDWPDISTKPFDHPFGPFADSFSEEQHKLGPFGPIRKLQGKNSESF